MLNKFLCMGRIVDNLELKVTPSGVNVVSFSVAVERDFKGANGEKQIDFIKVVAWRQTAAFIVNYFGKGRMICIEGSLQTRSYTTQNGEKRSVTEVLAEKVFFTGERKEPVTEPQRSVESYSNDFIDVEVDDTDDSLPF